MNASSEPSAKRHGAVASWLRNALTHPLARDLDLDSERATVVHGRMIREKAFLRRLYLHYYDQYEACIARATPGGIVLEVGAGGGFYSEVRPKAVSLDLRAGANVDLLGSALQLPLCNASTSAIVMLNVLHHLPDPMEFFREAERVLKPGGRVCLIEPYAGPLSRRLIRPLHHEPWDETAGWTLPPAGPLTGANMALPWIIFKRDRARYDREMPRLPVDRFQLHTYVLYLLSGGVSMRSMLPGTLFGAMEKLEQLFSPASPLLASMMTIELVKR